MTKDAKTGKFSLETERLLLRPWKKNKADAKALYRYAKDPRIGPNAGWPVHRDAADSLELIRTVLSTPGVFAMVLKETAQPIGCVSLTWGATMRKSLPHGDGELGYWVGVPYQGLGYATEAARRVIRWGFEELELSAIWAAYYEGNMASRRVQEKCGLTYQYTAKPALVAALGEVKTEHFMQLTRTQWQEHDSIEE